MNRRAGLFGITLVVVTWLTYLPSVRAPFLFDDVVATVENPTIRDLAALDQILSPPRNGSGVTGRPLVNASLALNYAIGGLSTYGYHVFNVLLHAASGLLLFGIMLRTLLTPRLHRTYFATSPLPAFAVALLWCLHPLQTESVSCVIQRTELLVGFFYLLTLYGFIRARDRPSGWLWPVVTIAAALAGMASKEVMVSAPLLVLLYDRTFLSDGFGAALRTQRGLYIGLAASWVLLAALLIGMEGSRGTSAGFGIGLSSWSYLLKQCEAIVRYLSLALWPHPLVLDYGDGVIDNLAEVAPQAVLLCTLVGATIVGVVRGSMLSFCGMWFFALLAPSSSFVPLVTQTMAEHRMYLPLAGVIAPAVVVLFRLLEHRADATMVLCAALGVVSVNRNTIFTDPLKLWMDNVAKRPQNPRGHDNLGLILCERGEPRAAIPHYLRALALNPKSFASRSQLGTAYLMVGHYPEAMRYFAAALEINPHAVSTRNNLGVLLLRSGNAQEAKPQFEHLVRLDPKNIDARWNLAIALASDQQFAAALQQLEQGLAIDPRHTGMLNSYGEILAVLGQVEAGLQRFDLSLQINPNQPGVREQVTRLRAALAGRPQPAQPPAPNPSPR